MSDHDLFVANTSLHIHEIHFTLEAGAGKKVYQQTIRMGDQVRILDRKLSEAEIDHFIKTMGVFGLRNAKDIANNHEYIGLAYATDYPVKLAAIKENYENNAAVLDEKRDTRLEASTVAIANMLTDKVQPAPVPLRRSSVEFIEQTTGEANPRINTGMEFVAEGVEPQGGRRGKRASGF